MQLQFRASARESAKNARLLVHSFEQIGMLHHGLRAAEQQNAARNQRVMKYRNNSILQFGVHVDEQVPAGDQAHHGKRRIANQVMRGESTQIADLFGDRVAPMREVKKRSRRSGDNPSIKVFG